MKFTSIVALALGAGSVFAAPSVVERQSCQDAYVYFARGTTEIGTLGTVVGPGLVSDTGTALRRKSKTGTVEGIPYAASLAGYLAGGDREGAATMASRASAIAASCPNAKIFLSGYSQGAQVAHLAARSMSSTMQARITGVVTFGDPYRDTALPGSLQSRRKTFCNFGDLICVGLPTVLAQHLTYGSDTDEAADWIAARV